MKSTSSVAIVAGMSRRVVPFHHQPSSTRVKQATRLADRKLAPAAAPASPIHTPGPAAVVRMPIVPLRTSPEVAMQSRESHTRQQASPGRPTRAGDLMLGGLLAVVLLIACIAWEAMSGAAVHKADGVHSGDAEVGAAVGAVR
jgi:hypothetical protein